MSIIHSTYKVFYSPFTKLFNKYLLRASYVLDTILGAEEIAVNKRQSFLPSWDLNYSRGDT